MSSRQVNKGPDPELGDKYHAASGKAEVIEVIKLLESAGISCCVVGTTALKYFGAHRATEDWSICVPTEKFEKAASLFKNDPLRQRYDPYSPRKVQPHSLYHTFPFFKCRGYVMWIVLVPSWDCQFECTPENFERSHDGLPYPQLRVFAQSLLDTGNYEIVDLVDGMDLTVEWGIANLQLEGPPSNAYIEKKNVAIGASTYIPEDSLTFLELPNQVDRGERFRWAVEGKRVRIDVMVPGEYYATRFRLKGSQDPRLPKEKVDNGFWKTLESVDASNNDVVVVDWQG